MAGDRVRFAAETRRRKNAVVAQFAPDVKKEKPLKVGSLGDESSCNTETLAALELGRSSEAPTTTPSTPDEGNAFTDPSTATSAQVKTSSTYK